MGEHTNILISYSEYIKAEIKTISHSSPSLKNHGTCRGSHGSHNDKRAIDFYIRLNDAASEANPLLQSAEPRRYHMTLR